MEANDQLRLGVAVVESVGLLGVAAVTGAVFLGERQKRRLQQQSDSETTGLLQQHLAPAAPAAGAVSAAFGVWLSLLAAAALGVSAVAHGLWRGLLAGGGAGADGAALAAWLCVCGVWREAERLRLDAVLRWVARFWIIAAGFCVIQSLFWAQSLVEWNPPTVPQALWAAAFAIKFIAECALVAVSYSSMQNSDVVQRPPEPVQPSPNSKSTSWTKSWARLRKLTPFLWPRGAYLQGLVLLCFLLLIAGRVVNVLVPFQYKAVIDVLTDANNQSNKTPYYAWGAILGFCSLRYLQGGVGVIQTVQSLLWTPVAQFNSREINVEMLRHLHNLSLQFHINRKTGEVLRVMDRGTSSVSSLLSLIVFSIFPIFVDITLAVIAFVIVFDVATGMVILASMMLYVIVTFVITEWRTKFRREMNTLDSLSRARAVDSLLNFETVKYYTNEDFEVRRFEQSIYDYQSADWKTNASLAVLNTAQNTVITLGLVVGALLVGGRVARGELTVGDFVLFLSYIVQLYQPLNWLGSYYRQINQNFVDMESMFDLLAEDVDIKDVPNAKPLMIHSGGAITFENVTFTYPSSSKTSTQQAGKPALRNLSFYVPARTTTAIVGLTGSGKSTIFRLLFRFYEPDSGRILVDGQDVSKVTQQSLRRAIGCVPQDTVLFNQSIMYNIAYGDVTATDDAVRAAARKAQIHDRIMEFPEQYATRVGERGLRLSGGEKQRVAIARTMLKNPEIILLDEATSALDNTTEQLIQRGLKDLTSRRTTLIIAHRLSTVVDADRIIVIRDGRVVESGTHDGLVKAGMDAGSGVREDGVGAYYIMWRRQAEEEVEVAAGSVVAAAGGSGGGSGLKAIDIGEAKVADDSGRGGGWRGGGHAHGR